ncbi:rhodanese-like domain-containing protein [Bacillus sp. WLY-B-L8]|uniref:rhodanese-like domain-containing protein n=1 Tax=Bacillus multifaciens TaxID=3068506 RepID=UPI0027415A61|nr:rhodanese-like domain-containing protein [Bacillus sp. WLY-B-L8]MDP7978845.1 rhodanese-like domain-containing protein [Bacillus sp. WLY-B-L8]
MLKMEYFKSRIASTFSPMDFLQVKKLNPDAYMLVDVRNGTRELKKEVITGALEIPQSELENRLSELPKDKIIILYCWDVWCNTAAKSALFLLENGYNVKELAGGIAAWKTMNLPTSSLFFEETSNSSCGC